MSARDDVLARVRTAVEGASAPPVVRAYRVTGSHSPGSAALLDLLEDRLVDYRAQVRRCGPDGVAAAVAAAVADGLAGRDLPPGRATLVVPPGLDAARLSQVDADVVVDDGSLSALDLDALHGVVTAATVAVAETGTVVLDGSPDQGRRAITLVPDLHVCIVRADQVVQTVPEAAARVVPTRPLTWISGPSATSDIELVRVEGVHGPRRLQVVLVGPGGDVQAHGPRGRTLTTGTSPTEQMTGQQPDRPQETP